MPAPSTPGMNGSVLRIKAGAVIDVDEVEACGFLADADLPGTGLADLDLFPLEDLGSSRLMDSDRVRHGRLQRFSAQKKSPAAADRGGALRLSG